MSGTITKAPLDVLDFDIDFAPWLVEGDAIEDAEAEVHGATVTVQDVAPAMDRVKVWLAGGASGESGTLTVTASTEGGRTKQVCLRLRVRGC